MVLGSGFRAVHLKKVSARELRSKTLASRAD
jgi:hypothetical protein